MQDMSYKLRTIAENMQEKIDNKLNPACANQNPTPRRERQASGMHRDGMELLKIQSILKSLADLHANFECPESLAWIKNASDVKRLLHGNFTTHEATFLKALEAGVVTLSEWQQAKLDLAALIDRDAEKVAQAAQDKRDLMNKELELVGVVDGYFPTPSTVVNIMLDWVQITPNQAFDPAAGGGRILDQTRERFPDCRTYGIEIYYTLAQIAQEKGHNVIRGDIYAAQPSLHDFIIMNPPFENKGDEKMIQYVYDHFLAPGGSLVSVVAGGRLESKTPAFQQFVNDHGDWRELPEGSFKQSKTGVNTFIVGLGK